MQKQFVQLNATKDSRNFAFCSNLSLMGNGMPYSQAITALNSMALTYEADGYKITWTVEPMSDEEFALYEFEAALLV